MTVGIKKKPGHAIKWKAYARQLFFPQRNCLICGAPIETPGICDACRAARGKRRNCVRCANFVDDVPGLCRDCADHPPLFVQARSAFPYEGKIRERILEYKYRDQVWLYRSLAYLMLEIYHEHYDDIAFDAVIPVPSSASRIKERGYDHTRLLSQFISDDLAILHRPDLLRRIKDTPRLADLGREERARVMRGAFAAAKAGGLKLLLIDDVYTTGATMNSCCAALLDAGAAQIYGLTIAGSQ